MYNNSHFKANYIWGATTGVYINFRFQESISALYSQLAYSRLGTQLKGEDTNNFHFDLRLRYEYITWDLLYKAYIWNGLYLGLGPRLGFNLTPEALFYTSNGSDTYGPDIREQQKKRNVLKGRSDFSVGVGAGYELENGFSFHLRYYHGLNDVMETLANNNHYIEVQNSSRVFQFTIGYVLPYSMNFNKNH
jgi:hypothetical protein